MDEQQGKLGDSSGALGGQKSGVTLQRFTPGPWQAIKWGNRSSAWRIATVPDKHRADIANVLGGDQTLYATGNARLIAAAPTMLAALKDAESALERCAFVGKDAMDGGIGAIDSALINIRAAIARAVE